MDIKKVLFELSTAYGAGTVCEVSDTVFNYLNEYMPAKRGNGLTVIGKLNGRADYTLMLDAHIDEVAFIVTDIDENGFLRVAKCGGIDIRTLPARRVTVHSKKKIPAAFCSVPPHISSGDLKFEDISEFKIDTLLGEKAKDFISVGDYVTYSAKPVSLLNNRVSGKSFDDRAGAVCLLELADRLKDKELPFNVCFLFSDQEELGLRGCKTATFEIFPDEAVAIDVSFGDGPDISPYESGMLSCGAMIGMSPVLENKISRKMVDIAENENIPYQTEVMGGKTGTNADVISLTKSGVKTGLISIPLRNMHTETEIVDIDDIVSVCDILEKYILSGGVMNV